MRAIDAPRVDTRVCNRSAWVCECFGVQIIQRPQTEHDRWMGAHAPPPLSCPRTALCTRAPRCLPACQPRLTLLLALLACWQRSADDHPLRPIRGGHSAYPGPLAMHPIAAAISNLDVESAPVPALAHLTPPGRPSVAGLLGLPPDPLGSPPSFPRSARPAEQHPVGLLTAGTSNSDAAGSSRRWTCTCMG